MRARPRAPRLLWSTTPAVAAPHRGGSCNRPRRTRLRSSSRRGTSSPCSTTGSPTTLGSVATPPGLHDPFASPRSSEAAVAPVTPTTPCEGAAAARARSSSARPAPGKVAVTGWIVILASIPTAAGESCRNVVREDRRRKAGLGADLGAELVEPAPASRRLLGRLHRPVHEPHASERRCRQRP